MWTEVTPCVCNPDDLGVHRESSEPFVFTEAVWMKILASGWVRHNSPWKWLRGNPNDIYLRTFPPEMHLLYRSTLLSDDLLPQMEGLLTFISNMDAANRIFMPTSTGWQMGNYVTQMEVARMAGDLARVGNWKSRP